MATDKRKVSPKEKPGKGDKGRGEFAVMSVGQTGEGRPGKEYSNNSGSREGFRQVTSTIGNK